MPDVGRVSLLARIQRLGVTLLFAAAIVLGGGVGLLLAYATDLPQVSSLEDFQPNIITEVYTADGKVLGSFAIERRVIIGFKDIPPVYRNAVVAVEDAEFWKHLGINLWRIPAALYANVRSGHKAQGSSTLTMQLSRLLFLTPEKSYERKIKEIILAFQIEKNFTKEEIFTFYANQVYFGNGNYGVEAASQFYFSKSAKDLTLTEAALVAGLPQGPSRLSPVDHPEAALARRNHVLSRMAEEKYITSEESARAQGEPLALNLHRDPPSISPYFLEEVRKYLEREYGSQRIYQGGLRVYTTLDSTMQRAANVAVRGWLRQLDRRSRGFVPPASILKDGVMPARVHLDEWDWPFAAGDAVRGVVLSSDRGSAVVQIGDYRARVGLADIAWTRKTSVDAALPRGAVAPFALLTLDEATREATVKLEQDPKVEGSLLALDPRTGAVKAMVGGYDFDKSKFNRATQAYRQVGSAFKPFVYAAAIEKAGYNPATILVDAPISFPSGSGGVWSPRNFDGAFEGPISLRHALEDSRNIPAIKTLNAIGIQTGIDYAHKLGLAGELQPYLPLAIGASEATLQEMVAAYATFPNQGLRMTPMWITRITDRDGNVVEEQRPHATDAIRADTAYIMASMLRGVIERGTAVRARSLKRPIAGKTGTTNDFTDAWFIGFEPSLACGVWVGYDDKRISLGPHEEGARAALPMWMNFWEAVMKDKPIEEFQAPPNIVFASVGGVMEPFVAGTEPRTLADAAPSAEPTATAPASEPPTSTSPSPAPAPTPTP